MAGDCTTAAYAYHGAISMVAAVALGSAYRMLRYQEMPSLGPHVLEEVVLGFFHGVLVTTYFCRGLITP
jgi:hypothetical protein